MAWMLGVLIPGADGTGAGSSPHATRATRKTAIATGAVRPDLNLMSSYSGHHYFLIFRYYHAEHL